MKHIVTVVAIALSLLVSATSMARDGDGRRSYDRGHSSRGDGYRGHREYRDRHYDSRRHFDRGRGFYDRRFDRDYRFRGDRRFNGRFYDDRRFYDRRFYDRRYYGGPKYYGDRYYKRSYWRRGDRLPSAFLGARFVVNDFRSYNLYRPPYGYRWVRVERDAFLTGVATGVIIAVVADHF